MEEQVCSLEQYWMKHSYNKNISYDRNFSYWIQIYFNWIKTSFDMMKNVIKQKYISLNTNLFWLNKNTFWYHEKNWLSATFQQQYWINHSHKKRKDSLETRTVLLIFLIELEISGVAVQRIHQNSEEWWLLGGLVSENDFKTVLVTFCCSEHGAKASETAQKIATDQKVYRKCSSCVIIQNLLNSQNMLINQ